MVETTTAPTTNDGNAEATAATAAAPTTAATGLPTTTSSAAFWAKSKAAFTEYGWLSSAATATAARLWRQRRWQPVYESQQPGSIWRATAANDATTFAAAAADEKHASSDHVAFAAATRRHDGTS